MAEIGINVEPMAQKVADAINNAQAGAIIDQSEEQVRDAYADFKTTHKFYLRVRNDLLHRARQVNTRGLCPKLLKKCCSRNSAQKQKRQAAITACQAKLKNGQGRI